MHPGDKTDDHDLEAIFHAAIKGYGLTTPPVGEAYQALQAASRHRHNLVKQRSRLMVQIRRLLHQTISPEPTLYVNILCLSLRRVTTLVSVAADTPITNISVLSISLQPTTLKFAILNHANHAFLYLSPPITFAPDIAQTPRWRRDPDFQFTLLAGRQYDIGFLSAEEIGTFTDGSAESSNGIPSALGLVAINPFNAPAFDRHFNNGIDLALRLHVGSANERQQLAFTEFDWPPIGAGTYLPTQPGAELGFQTTFTATG